MIFKCIIIDDEPHFTELLEEYIAEIPQLELIKTFHDPLKALAEVGDDDQIDIVFLDIIMPRISGIELAPIFKKKSRFLVFITAHSQHAVKAFDLEADDFLFKPFKLARLQQTVNKIIGKNAILKLPEKQAEEFYIKSLGTQSKYIKFLFSEIIAFESDKNYIKIYTRDRCYRFYMGIKEVEEKLADRTDFIRVHRSFIISTEHIEEIDSHTVTMKNSKVKVIIGDRYREAFLKYLEKNSF